MKVLMTTDCIGGVWTYCMELCAALAQSGVQITLASMGGELSGEQQAQAARLPNVDLQARPFRLCWMQQPWDDLEQAGDWLLALEQQYQPDLIHLNDLGHGGLPWRAPVLLVGHSCVLSWWLAVKKIPAPENQWRRYQELVRNSVQHADLVVAPTETMLAALQQHYGPAAVTTTIPNGRGFPAWVPSAQAKASVAQPLVFTAGRLWDEAKNVAALQQIAGDLDWPVYAAGEAQQERVDGEDSFHALGQLTPDQLSQWLTSASIYAAPAHYEPFGLAILEAARARCALVLGDIPSLREVWGNAALYVDSANPNAIRQAIQSLIANPTHLHRMAERAWKHAHQYPAQKMAAQYLRSYQFLIQPRALSHNSVALA